MNGFRLLTCALAAATSLLLPMRAAAQAEPSAYKDKASLWAGASWASFDASFPYQSGSRITGAGAFVDYNFGTHLSVEGEANFLNLGGYQGESERSYLAGPRFRFNRIAHLHPYFKTLAGIGHIHFPYQLGESDYFAIAPGAGAEYRFAGRLLVRAEYEYQVWLNSPGFSTQPDHPIHPKGFTVGIAYRLR